MDTMYHCDNKLPSGLMRELKRQVYTFNLKFNKG